MVDFNSLPVSSKLKLFLYIITALGLPLFLLNWGWSETQTAAITFVIYGLVGVPLFLKEAFKYRPRPVQRRPVVPSHQVHDQSKQPKPVPIHPKKWERR